MMFGTPPNKFSGLFWGCEHGLYIWSVKESEQQVVVFVLAYPVTYPTSLFQTVQL
jgi:hypothetical protein